MQILLSLLFHFNFQTSAKPLYFNQLKSAVPTARLSQQCMTCHQGRGRNVFGNDYTKFFFPFPRDPDYQTIVAMSTAERWEALLAMDSDQDGVSNLEELLADTHPAKP